jgi:hypothetical protein
MATYRCLINYIRLTTLYEYNWTNLMGVSRYTNAAVQGIQARMDIANLEPWVKIG